MSTANKRNQLAILGDPDREVLTDPQRIRELLSRVVWPSHEPIQFLRRRGTASPKDEDDYVRFHTRENIDAMYELGIRMPKRFHLFKGFGLKHEWPEIKKTIECAKYLHEKGMRISVYVGGTLFADTFFKEVPEARNWLRIDQSGHPITYSGYQMFRYFACLNHPDYRAYIKKVLDIALYEVEADEIFFDNQILRYEPRSCRCEYCIRHLREMVRRKYTPEELERRYGFAEVPDLMPPIWSQAARPELLPAIRDPGLQDWVDHRCLSVFEFYQDMYQHVKAARPEVAVGINIKGIHGHNRAFDHGIDHNLFYKKIDFAVLDAGQAHPRMEGRALVSEIRSFKAGQALRMNFSIGDHSDLGVSTYQVFTYRKKIEGFGWLGHMDGVRNFSPVAQFFRANQRLFVDREHLYDVAVLRSSPSTNYNNITVHENLYPMEQTLLVYKVPFGIIFDNNIHEIDRYRVIVLAEQESLSDQWLDTLYSFVENGGGVLATGNTAFYDHWRRPRTPDHGLSRFVGGPPPDEPVRKQIGKGRFSYLPKLELPYRMSRTDWPYIDAPNILPLLNSEQVVEEVRWLAGGAFSVEAAGPETVVMEVIDGYDDLYRSIHFVNFDPANAGQPLRVQADVSGLKDVKVVLRGPELSDTEIRPAIRNDRAAFEVPAPKVYCVVQIHGRKA